MPQGSWERRTLCVIVIICVLPEEKELTARQDERVTNLGHFLQTIEVTAEDFERTT